MTLDIVGGLAAWWAARSLPVKTLLTLATTLVFVDLLLRAVAPGSRAQKAWTGAIEAVGEVWTAVILSLVYLLSVGPVSVGMRLFGKDPLDRSLGPAPTSWQDHEPNPLGPRAAARHQF